MRIAERVDAAMMPVDCVARVERKSVRSNQLVLRWTEFGSFDDHDHERGPCGW